MMKEMAAATADHQGQAPQGGQSENPCKQGLACQVSVAVVATPPTALVAFVLTTQNVDHRLAAALAAPSHPPDRSLRPPILL